MANVYEEFKVHSHELVDKVKEMIHEGNVRRIIIRDEKAIRFWKFRLPLRPSAW